MLGIHSSVGIAYHSDLLLHLLLLLLHVLLLLLLHLLLLHLLLLLLSHHGPGRWTRTH